MRASASLGVLVAGAFLHHAAAQDSYGNPDGSNDGGNPAGQDNSPQGTVTLSGGNPNNPHDGPNCLMEGTTTVFVTVLPTSPQNPGETDVSDENASDQTVVVTVHPTETVQVSPLASPDDEHSVKPFTTLTIDIWGDGSNHPIPSWDVSPTNTGSSFSGPSSVNAATYNDRSPSVHRTGSGTPTYGAAGLTESNKEHDDQATGSQTPWYTVVTDTNVEWTTGSDGATPFTVVSEHTITLDGGASPSGLSAEASWTSWTVTGADGKPTIVESSVDAAEGSNDVPVSTVVVTQSAGSPSGQAVTTLAVPQSPVTTITAVVSAPAFPQSVSTTCTSYTVLGTDGVPTVVHSTRVIESMSITSAASNVPTLSTSAQGLTQGGPDGSDITSCTSYTIIGTDGRQTVVQSTLVIPASSASASWLPQNLPNGMPGPITSLPNPLTDATQNSVPSGITTGSTYTIVGPDGQLTVVDVTYVIPGPSPTSAWGGIPSGAGTGNSNPVTATASGLSPQDMKTCVSYTVIGTDGRPTVLESTVIMPATASAPNTVIPFPSVVPQGQASELPQGTVTSVDDQNQAVTTCITIDVVGPDGKTTPTVETIVLSPAGPAPTAASLTTAAPALPSFVPQALSDLPQGLPPSQSAGAVTISAVTLTVIGPNGQLTPVVQTVVITPAVTSPVVASGVLAPQSLTNTAAVSGPVLEEYGSPEATTLPVPSAVVSGVDGLPPGQVATSASIVFTGVTGPGGIPALSAVTVAPSALVPQNSQGAYCWLPADITGQASPGSYGLPAPFSSLQTGDEPMSLKTSTWVNLIAEPTTTYTMKFPLTTLATVKVPGVGSSLKRFLRRQASGTTPGAIWSNTSSVDASPLPENTSLGASLTSALEATMTPSSPVDPPTAVPTTPSASTGSSAMCPAGGQIGNVTLNFDTVSPGPLFNPSGALWFSEGFLIAPPSTESNHGFLPSSGGQLVEFVPPALLPAAVMSGSGDTAEIGVGPNSANPCFRFDLFGANLGCAAEAKEQWCEFEVSAYRFDPLSASEKSIAWSEVKRVPACPTFPNAPCALTPVVFEGYRNITSVLVRLRVGLELRAWWADDLKFGWEDNTCEAATCRAGAAPHAVKRETVESALTKGVWHWVPQGLRRMDDAYIWGSVS